jgi:hypothetical protein
LQELDAMIKRGRAVKLDIFRIAQRITAVYTPASDQGSAALSADSSGSSGSGGGGGGNESLAALSDADIEAMDAASLRRLLLVRGLPGSGRIAKLRERPREARDVAPLIAHKPHHCEAVTLTRLASGESLLQLASRIASRIAIVLAFVRIATTASAITGLARHKSAVQAAPPPASWPPEQH